MAATDKNMNFDVNLLPTTTGDHNLGSSDKKWNLYVNNINGSTYTNYSLPLAASGTRGGIQIGYSTSAANRKFAVALSSEKAYVEIPLFVKSGSTAAPGLVPTPSTTAGTGKFLCEDGTWKTPSYTSSLAWSSITNTPTTLNGYGITDAASSDHVHGEITNDGKLNTASQAVVTDASKNITTQDLTVSSMTADSGTTTTFVYSVTQSSTGKVTVKTKSLPTYNNYSLPIAKFNTLGGVKPAYTSTNAVQLTTSAASNTNTPTIAAKTTTEGRYYAIEADKNGIIYVNIPWENTTYTANTTSIGSASAGTAIAADDITDWTTNTPTVVTKKTVVTGGTKTAIPNISSNTVVTSATGATATYSSGILTITDGSFSSGDSVTTGTAIEAYTSLTTGDSVEVTAGTAANLSYTARSIPNISVSSTTVATGITAS